MRKVIVAATQMHCSDNIWENIMRADNLVRQAAAGGANIILIQELFENLYFCQKEKPIYYSYATNPNSNMAIRHFKKVAQELNVVLPISFYEKSNNALYNSVAMINADGQVMGIYRKSHIPDGPGYEEKYYFNPGDTGFKVWNTRYGKIGVGICWDQWFPEAARCMVLMGAELLFYPTAIGTEPENPEIDSKNHWQRCMQGHSACNLVPVIASNRTGVESIDDSRITFYGSSFITDQLGEIVAQAGRYDDEALLAEFDLDFIQQQRIEWGIFRDRRPELYKAILTYDGGGTVDNY